MGDIIQLLTDAVANQIAAGEVIQRPASAVKELLENAVDSGADDIRLLVKEAGKTLIHVVDNGKGMSESDARLCFERHATSKIRKAEDLWQIRTKGFRGEALASIAAVAQVELKTREAESELGTVVEVEGSAIKKHEPDGSQPGTSIAVKNLFYNVPARRNFLKSNPVEARHIHEEFTRIALAHPEIQFRFIHNGLTIQHLPVANLKRRIVNLFGQSTEEFLVKVEEQTTILELSGFICKPEFAKKTRGEQYLFVNHRFIRDAYLNHAIVNAYDQLLPERSYPSYFLFLEVDPASIDVNIHPTKTEIKFQDEKSVYAILRSAVKHALGQYSISPPLDFDAPTGLDIRLPLPGVVPSPPKIKINPEFNPFDQGFTRRATLLASDLALHPVKEQISLSNQPAFNTEILNNETWSERNFFQAAGGYIIIQSQSGVVILDQENAHERVLYERFFKSLQTRQTASQQDLFPQTLELSPAQTLIAREILEEIRFTGLDVREFGANTFVVHGIPAGLQHTDIKSLLETILEDYNLSEVPDSDKKEKLARAMARRLCLKKGIALDKAQIVALLSDLKECSTSRVSPSGRNIFVSFTASDLDRILKK